MRLIKIETWAIRILFCTIFFGISSSIFKINTLYSEQIDKKEITNRPKNDSKVFKKITINDNPVFESNGVFPVLNVPVNNVVKPEKSFSNSLIASRFNNTDISSFTSNEDKHNYIISKSIPMAGGGTSQGMYKLLLMANKDLPLIDNKDIYNDPGNLDNELNYSETQQIGSENNALHEVHNGYRNLSRIVQFGNNNFARHVISLDNNIIQTFQSGDYNFSDVVSSSSNNTAIVNQVGSGNKSVIKQSGTR